MSKGKSAQRTSQKTLIIAVIAAAVLLGVVVALLLFLRSPERQLASGLANLVTAKTVAVDGTVISSSQAGKATVRVQGVTDKQAADGQLEFNYVATDGPRVSGKAQVFANKDATYVKLDQPGKLIDEFSAFLSQSVKAGDVGLITQASMAAQVKLLFSGFADKVDNKWIKVTQQDLRGSGAEMDTDCYAAFAEALGSNKKASSQLASAYRQYQFFVVADNLKSDGSSKGYHVSIDSDTLKKFQAAVKDNEAVKQLGSCGVDVLSLGASGDISGQGVDIWVDKISNNITRFKYTKTLDGGGSSSVDLRLSYDKSVQTVPPKASIDFKSILPSAPGLISTRP